MIQCFARELNKQGLMLQLSQLRRPGSAASILSETLLQSRWTAADSKINICPFISVKDHTWESYLGTLGSSQRYNFNRRLKNLTKNSSMSLECVRRLEDAQPALDVVIALHRKRWGSRGNSEAFQTSSVEAFHREFVNLAAQREWLRLITLRLNGTPAAALYGLRYGPTFYFYQSGFDPLYAKQSAGLVLMGLAIKTAIEEGVSEYDLLHGDEEYKFHWASGAHELGRLELYPPHTPGRIYRHAIAFNRAARQMAKRVLSKGL